MNEVCNGTSWAGAVGFSTMCICAAVIIIAFMWMLHRESMADKR